MESREAWGWQASELRPGARRAAKGRKAQGWPEDKPRPATTRGTGPRVRRDAASRNASRRRLRKPRSLAEGAGPGPMATKSPSEQPQQSHSPQPPQRGASGGSAPGAEMTSAPGPRFPRTEGTQVLVGMGGVEPPRPFGHTDLNRARLPFRHIPVANILCSWPASCYWQRQTTLSPVTTTIDTACDAEKISTASQAAIRGSEVPATAA